MSEEFAQVFDIFVITPDWTQFVKNKLWAWEQTNLSWAKNFTGEVKLVFYDDLVENVEGTLRSVLKFLKFPINDVWLRE